MDAPATSIGTSRCEQDRSQTQTARLAPPSRAPTFLQPSKQRQQRLRLEHQTQADLSSLWSARQVHHPSLQRAEERRLQPKSHRQHLTLQQRFVLSSLCYSSRVLSSWQMFARLTKNPSVLNLPSLCIVPGRYIWVIYVDIVILECSSGNIVDCIGLAAKAALLTATIPVVELTGNGVDEPLDFELSDDPHAVQKLPAANFPLFVTMTKIGSFFVVDATAEEDSCVHTNVLLAVNPQGNICALQKTGHGAVAPGLLLEMMAVGRATAARLEEVLQEGLAQDALVVRRATGFL
eukprot:m.246739 g.246739  ORF g.246739 m.246739 type:complete len:292 (-) comp54475_c0_seq2:359-1234(-)